MGERIIINLEGGDILLAARAAKYLLERPEKQDAYLVYGESDPPAGRFWVKRNKSSISVFDQLPLKDMEGCDG